MPGPAEMRMFRLAGLRLGVDREPRALLWPDASDVGHTIRLSRSPPPRLIPLAHHGLLCW
jgi:hypothetical protein